MPGGETYHARFSNGRTLERTSYRSYTHAWLATGRQLSGERIYEVGGFSTSAAQAHKNMAGEIAPYIKNGYAPSFSEVVALSTNMSPMSPTEFRAALEKLGFVASDRANDLGLSEAARFFGAQPRAARDWNVKGPPAAVALCLRLMLKLKLSADKVRKLLEDKHG